MAKKPIKSRTGKTVKSKAGTSTPPRVAKTAVSRTTSFDRGGPYVFGGGANTQASPATPRNGDIRAVPIPGRSGWVQRQVYQAGQWRMFGAPASAKAVETGGLRADISGRRVVKSETAKRIEDTERYNEWGTRRTGAASSSEKSLTQVGQEKEKRRGRYVAVERQKVGRKFDPKKMNLPKREQYVTEKGFVANIRKYRAGDVYDPKRRIPLGPRQYIDSEGRIRNTTVERARIARLARVRKLRFERLTEEQKQVRLNNRHQAKLRKQRVRDRAGRNVVRKQMRATAKRLRERKFISDVRKLRGYGKQPLHFARAKSKTLSKLMPGQKKLLAELSHAKRYPAVGHRLGKPMRPPVPMGGLRGDIPLESLYRPRGGPGQLATTTRTLTTERFPHGGTGIYFRLDATRVIENLAVKYPKQLLAASKKFAPQIGRKLLDIIEPFVPKDTGLLYSTATEVSGRELSGGIDLSSLGVIGKSSFGVAISYNAPYAEMVYYDTTKAHGREYNVKHGTDEKGDKETARWIEAAYNPLYEGGKIRRLMEEYAKKMVGSLKSVRMKG